ncbi:sigma-70 family RNA polymerase sigma factor [Microbacterium soli]|uniref:RNA polymerase sigma-70 region 2 domain-containing protein n=1 Tax=Microbacterium soli TaxID=446075 RepID=A0ABP7MWD2_9MICO
MNTDPADESPTVDADPPATAPPATDEDHSALSDNELVDLLRGGDLGAYEELWRRHIVTARLVARRIASSDQEDLVSEAFLAVFQQVAVDGKGPHSSFRAYLFAVMRNVAARWYREGRVLVHDVEPELAVNEPGYDRIEREHDDAQLLDAFRALPDRWQRVLWLSDVEHVDRPAIAKEMGIAANAVSALRRRARVGLREQWLTRQLPPDLRDDRSHVAHLLPRWITAGDHDGDPRFAAHLADCDRCRRAESDLRLAYGSRRGAAASVSGLAALGVILPGATTLWAAPTSASIAAGVGLSLAASTAAIIGAVVLGVGTGFLPPPVPSADAPPIETAAPAPTPPAPAPPLAEEAPEPIAVVIPEPAPPEGLPEPEPIDFFVPDGPIAAPPTRPAPTPAPPGSVPPPADGGMDPGDQTPPGSGPEGDPRGGAPNTAPAVAVSSPASTYLAPTLSGRAPAESVVAIAVADAVYTVEPSPSGDWSFDVRSLSLPAGDYVAQVWTVAEDAPSPASEVPFTLEPVTVTGFEGDVLMDLGEASTTGLVFTATGPASGTLCVASDVGQEVSVPLDADGSATRRIRFLTTGFYALSLSACDDGYHGPTVDAGRWVSAGIFDPWDDVPFFELSEVDDTAPVPEQEPVSDQEAAPEPSPIPEP